MIKEVNMFDILNNKNFELYIIKKYINPQCEGIEEFYEDINRIKYIKRLLGRYHTKGYLRERLILNHIIILNNVFGSEACCRILFFKIEKRFHSYIKSFLHYLNYLPKKIPEISLEEISTDHKIDNILRNLK